MTRTIFILFFFISSAVTSQEKIAFSFYGEKDRRIERLEKRVFKNQDKAFAKIERLRKKHLRKGYVLASVDSIIWNGKNSKVWYYKGPKFDKINILIDEKDEFLVRKVPRLRERTLFNAPFKPKEVAGILFKISKYLENNGYPFAKVYLEVDDLLPGKAKAELKIERGEQVLIKEIHIKGESEVSATYLTNTIGIREGDSYNESRLADISNRVEQINFIDEVKPHEILFTPEGAELYMYLESNPVSLINGVVGLQPDPVTGDNVITGDVRLKLQNVLNRGELLDLNWRSLQPQTQDLKLRLNYPFLFNTPFGVDGKFDLYRRDSSFLTTNFSIGAQYFMRGGNYLKIFFESDNSNLLSGALNGANVGNLGLPGDDLASVSSNRYGIGLYRRRLDYLPNPSRGFVMEIDGLIGRRSSRRPDADSANVTTTYSLRSDIEWFIPITKRHVVRLANRTRIYYAPDVFVNELYRFGGLTTQRGFDEEELFASSLSTLSVEYRFLVDRNSHAFAFYEQSLYENNADGYYQDTPFGVGAGFSFGTNIGIFAISYAVGQQFDNPMLLRNGKVHFGYVSYF